MNKNELVKQLKNIAILLSSQYTANLQIEVNVQKKDKVAKVTIKECNL